MADKSQSKRNDPTTDQHLHTPGGMAQPAARRGRADEDAADLADTDMSMNPPNNFGRVQPPEPYEGDTDDAPGGTGLPSEPDSSAVRRLEGELDQLRDQHIRLAADFDNYRKRMTRERTELSDRAQGSFIARLLEVLDDVDRLVAGPADTPVAALREGLVLVDRKLRKELEAAGLERVDPSPGEPFDPAVHEAVAVVAPPTPDQDHKIAATYQAGYRFKGMLIRPARVQVYSGEGHA